MIVCLCHRISDRDIRRAAVDGSAQTFEELQDETCIARNCECCEECAREIFDEARCGRAIAADPGGRRQVAMRAPA